MGLYEKQRQGLGDEFLDELGAAVRLIREFPLGQPEFYRGTRRILLSRFPYGVAYLVIDATIQVIVIAHLSRAASIWRKRL